MDGPIPRIPLIVGIALLGITVAIGLLGKLQPEYLVESFRVNQWLHQNLSPAFDPIANLLHIVFTPPGAIATLVIAGGLIWLITRRPWYSLQFVVTAGLGWVTTGIFKPIFREPRPPMRGLCPIVDADPCPHLPGYEVGYNSFPSGHTAFMASLVVTTIVVLASTWITRRWLMVLGAILVISMAVSRLYLGVHYLADVVGGILAAIGTVLIVNWAWQRYFPFGPTDLAARRGRSTRDR
ncbi:MAG: phosphatase PAP2 family protein [Promicromonosporaceae bacterium]|nr:phosphatase PAP2 family protein [Promicromonosporaceae bacterium]